MRIAIYTRVAHETSGTSIYQQLRECRAWCELHGHDVTREFTDIGYRHDGTRVMFDPMIEFAMDPLRPIDAILVHCYSRFGRDFDQYVVAERRLNSNGVTLLSATQPSPDDPRQKELVGKMLAVFTEFSNRERARVHSRRGNKRSA